MVLEIVTYGHPALRAKGRRADPADPKLAALAADMIDTMRDAEGVGLAAQQVALPVQLCVVDISGANERPSRMWIAGTEVNPSDHMPLVLLNPQLELSGPERKGTEGCLSFPGIRADIPRPPRAKVTCDLLDGRSLTFECDGLLARAIQHEYDHLHGVLFIDRMGERDKRRLAREIESLLD